MVINRDSKKTRKKVKRDSKKAKEINMVKRKRLL
jgi:hypothetical protein